MIGINKNSVRQALLEKYVNTEIAITLNMQLLDIITKISKKQELSAEGYQELEKLREKLAKFTSDRTFKNRMDLKFLREDQEW